MRHRDKDGFLALAPKQKERFGKWSRPDDFCSEPTLIYAVSSFSIKQVVCISSVQSMNSMYVNTYCVANFLSSFNIRLIMFSYLEIKGVLQYCCRTYHHVQHFVMCSHRRLSLTVHSLPLWRSQLSTNVASRRSLSPGNNTEFTLYMCALAVRYCWGGTHR